MSDPYAEPGRVKDVRTAPRLATEEEVMRLEERVRLAHYLSVRDRELMLKGLRPRRRIGETDTSEKAESEHFATGKEQLYLKGRPNVDDLSALSGYLDWLERRPSGNSGPVGPGVT